VWPTRGSGLGTANVAAGTSSHGTLGVYQNLGTGVGGFDHSGYLRAGTIARRAQSSAAFRVWGNFYKRWTREGEFLSYLGWPLTGIVDDAGHRWQGFEGGCIYTYNDVTFHDRPWGQGECDGIG
jgi:hypothetical protein